VFNAAFNNISVISWWSVLLVEETGGPGETHRKSLTNFITMMLNIHNNVEGLNRVNGISTPLLDN
jgi:hypothetical protein